MLNLILMLMIGAELHTLEGHGCDLVMLHLDMDLDTCRWTLL